MLSDMCMDADMVCLYEDVFLHRSVQLQSYWRQACAKHNEKRTDDTWRDGAFATIMNEYKICALSGEHPIATRDIICTYLCMA